MIKTRYRIAGIIIEIQSPRPIKISERFAPFLIANEEEPSDWQIDLREVDALPEVTGVKLFSNLNYAVYEDYEKRLIKVFHDYGRANLVYAVSYMREEEHQISIVYLKENYALFEEDGNSFFHIGWERILIQEKRILLHAACIDTPIGGILFTGPSGIGKSTQADLWCRHKQAELINGDRVILSKENTNWNAYGSPYAGSSRCYVNQSCRINGIVVLKQAKECSIRKLGMLEAFRSVYAGLTINSWNADFVSTACDLAQKLVMDVPVYELSCTPKEEAVNLLYENLKQGGRG